MEELYLLSEQNILIMISNLAFHKENHNLLFKYNIPS